MTSITSHKSPNAALGAIDPEWEEYYRDNAHLVPKLVGTPKEMRDMMEELKIRATASAPQITQGLTVRDSHVIAADGYKIPIRIYIPTSLTSPAIGLVYIHGGGWTLGDLEGEDVTCRVMCVNAGVTVVSVDYRLAPENPFPLGLNDVWDVLLWTRENISQLHIADDELIIAGSSSGGNMAAVLAHRARDSAIRLRGQILRIPSVCHIDCYPQELSLLSIDDLKDAPLLSKRSMELFYQYYAPPIPSDPEASPLLNPNFNDLAPAYLQVAGLDPLRDEGLAYAEKLKKAGIATKLDIYPGLPHAFGYFPVLSAARKNSKDLIEVISIMSNRELRN